MKKFGKGLKDLNTYNAQLQPDYDTGDFFKIVIWRKEGFVPIDTLIDELKSLDIIEIYEPTNQSDFEFDKVLEFVDDRLLIYFGHNGEITLKPTVSDALIFRIMTVLRESHSFSVVEDLKHPIIAPVTKVGILLACVGLIGILLIALIDEAPGDPNISGWQLAIFATSITLFSVGFHVAIEKAGESIGNKFPKPLNLTYVFGFFAVVIFIFLGAFS